jgi:hypothetical protein
VPATAPLDTPASANIGAVDGDTWLGDEDGGDEYFDTASALVQDGKKKAKKKIRFHARRYDVLVATDAIAMGLNLSIRRVIFSTMEKFDGITNRKLHSSVSRCIHAHLLMT